MFKLNSKNIFFYRFTESWCHDCAEEGSAGVLHSTHLAKSLKFPLHVEGEHW